MKETSIYPSRTQGALDVLNYYNITDKEEGDLVFPIGFEETETGYDTYSQKRERINKRFKNFLEELGYDQEFTSYWIRHSWASIGREVGQYIEKIGAGPGHDSYATTQIYLEDFEDEVIDETNEAIVAATIK